MSLLPLTSDPMARPLVEADRGLPIIEVRDLTGGSAKG